jgi:hypothetical protein
VHNVSDVKKIGKIGAEFIQGRGVIFKLINSIWNKEELPDQWKKYIIETIHKKSDKIDYNCYSGTSLSLSTSYKILWNILF